MKHKLLIISLLLPSLLLAQEPEYLWKRSLMDASRTGVTVPGANNIDAALGTVKGKTYTAPNGKTYKGGSIAKIAQTVIDAQEPMAPLKKVVGYSPEAMTSHSPESPLSNWFADNLIRVTEQLTGKHVDMSVGNYGGIRVAMPEGDVLLDDIRSMFPFRNNVYYLTLRGSDIRQIIEGMVSRRIEVLGGVRIVVKQTNLPPKPGEIGGPEGPKGDEPGPAGRPRIKRELVSIEIGGEPLDDDKLYGVSTISFLLNGGDDLFMGANAVETIDCGVDIFEAVMMTINEDTAAGRPLTGHEDGRVTIIGDPMPVPAK